MRIASDGKANSYLVEREATHSLMADQYKQLCQFNEKGAEEVLTGALKPFRTAKWDKNRDRQNISVARPYWRQVLSTVKTRRVFLIGRGVEDEVLASIKARLQRQLPANWGNLTIHRCNRI